MSSKSVLDTYKANLAYAKELKSFGIKIISGQRIGRKKDISIDEYIDIWQKGIDAMEAGADPKLFEY